MSYNPKSLLLSFQSHFFSSVLKISFFSIWKLENWLWNEIWASSCRFYSAIARLCHVLPCSPVVQNVWSCFIFVNKFTGADWQPLYEKSNKSQFLIGRSTRHRPKIDRVVNLLHQPKWWHLFIHHLFVRHYISQSSRKSQ